MSEWRRLKLRDLLQRSTETIKPDPASTYREITVRLWGKGVVERGVRTGAEFAGTGRFVAHENQLILSRIDARNGAIGIVPKSLEGALVTNDFPLFDLDEKQIVPGFVAWLSKTSLFVGLCLKASEGTTNRVRLQEDRFLGMEVSLPPLDEQGWIVAQIDRLATKIREARTLREEVSIATDGIYITESNRRFRAEGMHAGIGDLCAVIDPNPSHRYPTYTETGVPIISSSEFVGEDEIRWDSARKVPLSFYEETLGRFNVTAGDVIFSRKGRVGYARSHPAGERLAMTHTLCVLKPDRARLHPRYLLHFARSRMFLSSLTGTMNPNVGVPTLGLGVIRSARIPLPSLNEQTRISDQLDELRHQVNALRRLQRKTDAELARLVPSILERSFRG